MPSSAVGNSAENFLMSSQHSAISARRSSLARIHNPRLSVYTILHSWFDRCSFHQIHRQSKECLEIELQMDKIEEVDSGTWQKIDQEVDIAIRPVIAARAGAKDRKLFDRVVVKQASKCLIRNAYAVKHHI